MKFTDKFFEFPIRIYNGSTVEELMDEEREHSEDSMMWIIGDMKIPNDHLPDLKWHEYFSEEDGVNGAIEREKEQKGTAFDCTMVSLRSGHEYICPWPKSKFEKKLNDFVEKMEAYVNEKKKQELMASPLPLFTLTRQE